MYFLRESTKKKGGEFFISYACLKKKVRGDREKLIRCVLLFRVFEQKKKRTTITTTTTTRNNNTNEKSKSE